MENQEEQSNLRKPISLRLSPEAIELLELMNKKMGVNRTALIEMGIRQLAQKEGVTLDKKD